MMSRDAIGSRFLTEVLGADAMYFSFARVPLAWMGGRPERFEDAGHCTARCSYLFWDGASALQCGAMAGLTPESNWRCDLHRPERFWPQHVSPT